MKPRPYDVAALLRPCPVLLVVPPFAWLDRPALGVHLLQGLARRQGVEVQVLYTNALFAAWFGERTASTLSNLQYGWFLGERLFARTAYGGEPLGADRGEDLVASIEKLARTYRDRGLPFTFGLDGLRKLEAEIPAWLDSFVPELARRGYRVVGASSSFEQTSASIAILGGIKRRAPATTTILGGANCEGEMARGIASLRAPIDHIFSGESEHTFPAWLAAHLRGEPQPAILEGAPCERLDELPTPDYDDYRAQLAAVLPPAVLAGSAINYETSRGCWWGQKSHCTFCGLNGTGMASRQKSPDRVIGELQTLVAAHPTKRVTMTDNIMPHGYFKTVVPRLAVELPGVRVMYEQKANLSLRQVVDLVDAGIDEIQPGIEALSSGLLALMAKGTTCAQNVALLRYARATGMRLQWNLLYGFPGDDIRFYEETLELLPFLRHLPPPRGTNPIVIDRFSPYHDRAAAYGIAELRPLDGYRAWAPAHADVDKLAYRFRGNFASESLARPDVIAALAAEVARWREAYYGPTPPELRVERDGAHYVLVDTRGLGHPAREAIDGERARVALVRQPRGASSEALAWARARGVVVERDRKLIPLAIAHVDLMLELEDSRAVLPLVDAEQQRQVARG